MLKYKVNDDINARQNTLCYYLHTIEKDRELNKKKVNIVYVWAWRVLLVLDCLNTLFIDGENIMN